MKQILKSLKTGSTEVAQVRFPAVKRGQLLIRSSHTLLSAGTVRMVLEKPLPLGYCNVGTILKVGAATGGLFVFKGEYRGVLIQYSICAEKATICWKKNASKVN